MPGYRKAAEVVSGLSPEQFRVTQQNAAVIRTSEPPSGVVGFEAMLSFASPS